MNQKSHLSKLFASLSSRWLLLALMVMMTPLAASAVEAYTCYTSTDHTLTFYYDNYRSSRPGTTYDLNSAYALPGWFLTTHDLVQTVTFDASFKNARPTSTYAWFYSMPNLRRINGISNLNTSSVTVMQGMFSGCSSLLYLDLCNFNTANVTDMKVMFEGCTALTTIDLTSFNTSKVTQMVSMFQNCSNLTTIYAGSGWNTAAVTNSNLMFQNCPSLVGGQGTTYKSSNPTDKTYARIDGGSSNPGYFTDGNAPMPYACYTPSNTTLTFYYDTQRRSRTGTTYFMNKGNNDPGWVIDDNHENVTKVVFNPSFADAHPTSMSSWFYEMRIQTIQGLNYLNTSEVTSMAYTFCNCDLLTSLDLSHFNTSKVTTMRYMFTDCQTLPSLDLSSFNTANVTDMEGMFVYCFNLATIYATNAWTADAATATDASYMFSDCYSLVGGKGTVYDEDHIGKEYAHIDGGPSNPGYFTFGSEAYACYTSSNTTLTFYYDTKRRSRPGTTYDLNIGDNEPGWYTDGTYANVTKVVFDPLFAEARPTSTNRWFSFMENLQSITGIEYLNTSEVTIMAYMFESCSGLTSLDLSNFNTSKVTDMCLMFSACTGLTSLDVSSFNTSQVTVMEGMFNHCSGLTSLDVSSFNTSNVTEMSYMFNHCSGLTSLDVSSFNTSNVTNMEHMFMNSSGLTSLDLSSFNTSKVTDLCAMFRGCSGLTSLDLSNFNTSKVTNMSFMFYCCSNLTSLDLSNFNTAKVTDMTCMFAFCGSLTSLDLSHFNTSNVTKMDIMFARCESLTSLYLSNFNTSKVTDMTCMFEGCSNLATIYVGIGWTTDAVTDSEYSKDMFENCTNLVGGKGTTYDANHIDKAYAHIDGGPGNPGYFTPPALRGDVNYNGVVDISDVVALINYILTGDATGIRLENANVNYQGDIDISDVVALIDYILHGYWLV